MFGYFDIRIASSMAPGAVRVREDVVYAGRGEFSRALGLHSPVPHNRPALRVVMVHDGVCGHAAVTVSDRVSRQARSLAALDDVKVRFQWLREHPDVHGIHLAGSLSRAGRLQRWPAWRATAPCRQ